MVSKNSRARRAGATQRPKCIRREARQDSSWNGAEDGLRENVEAAETSSGGEAARPRCSGGGKSQAAAPLVCGRTSYPSRFR
jgi:hypothetical protein